MKRVSFVTFCTRVLGLRLSNHQRVLVAVAIDGVDPAQLDDTDREIAAELFGDAVDVVPAAARRVQAWSLGRGSGKSTLAAALMLYVAVTASLARCGPGMQPAAVCLAPRTRTARLVVQIARALVRNRLELERMVVKGDDAKDGFALARDGRRVFVGAFAASKGGINVRGFDVLVLILDEAEFFASGSDYVVTDRDSYSACVPRLLPGPDHHALFISTPWPTPTLMGEIVERNHGSPSDALAAIGTSVAMRDNEADFAAHIESEKARDPETAEREYFCVRNGAGASGFFDPHAIDEAANARELEPDASEPGILVCAADFAFVRDSSTLVGARLGVSGLVRLPEIIELRPTRKEPLVPSNVARTFADAVKALSAREVTADAYSYDAMAEHFSNEGVQLVQAKAGLGAKVATYQRTRALLHDGRIRLPTSHALCRRLVAQLKAITQKATTGGALTISSPRRIGEGHGDLVSSMVLAVSQLPDAAYAARAAASLGTEIETTYRLDEAETIAGAA